jgi:hypothetical protein
MVKRRNSPYKSHDRSLATRVPIDCAPQMAPPMRRQPKARNKDPGQWSPSNPKGGFVI